MDTQIPPLKKGDLIAIVAPAKAIEPELVSHARSFFEEAGYRVRIGRHCTGAFHYFSGTDLERCADLQEAIDDPEVRAIVCARGGYGCIRILDLVNWAGMLRDPKWLAGFSDVTVFHQRMQRYGMQSIHGTMPLNFRENSQESLSSLLHALEGRPDDISIASLPQNQKGRGRGRLTGGNFSILYSLLGTDDQPDYTGSILFIEDLAEQLYHIDRMCYAFSKAGIFDQIRGLIVGGMTDMKDTAIPFGQTLEEIILSHFSFRNIPVAFGFPAGHIPDNRALVFGTDVELEVSDSAVNFRIFAP